MDGRRSPCVVIESLKDGESDHDRAQVEGEEPSSKLNKVWKEGEALLKEHACGLAAEDSFLCNEGPDTSALADQSRSSVGENALNTDENRKSVACLQNSCALLSLRVVTVRTKP